MSMIDFDKMVGAASHYLSYQERIGREFMIAESSLKFPIADYLTGLEFPLTKINLEYTHPFLKRRLIDLVLTDISGLQIETAFEFKIASAGTKWEKERERIFHDLMRLHLINASNGKDCYFLIAGTLTDFIGNFRSISSSRPIRENTEFPDPKGFYTEWFQFKAGEKKTFQVDGVTGNEYEPVYQSYLDDYEPRDTTVPLALPKSITTTCIAISTLSSLHTIPYVGGMWKVE